MPAGVDEAKWKKAVQIADNSDTAPDKDSEAYWKYVRGVYNRMSGESSKEAERLLAFRAGLLKEANMRNFLEGSLTGLTGFMLNRTPVRWAGEKYVNRFVLPDVIRKMTDKGIHYIPGRRNRELFLKTIAGLTADKANRKLLSGSIYEYMLDPDNRRMAIASKMKSILGPSPTKFVPTYYKPPIITDRFSGYTI